MNREILEKIINLTLEQIRMKGLDLLGETVNNQTKLIADEIEQEVRNFVEEQENEMNWEDAIDDNNHYDDDDMIVLDDGPLTHWLE